MPTKPHSVFYYVFWGVASLLATLFILGMGCVFLGAMFVSSARVHRANPTTVTVASNRVPVTVSPLPTPEENTAEYIQNFIQVSEFRAHDGPQSGVTFRIKNAGPQTVTRLEITVYLMDAQGNDIGEKSFLPVSNNPLKPNYIWQLDGNKYYPIDDAPREWFPPRTHYKITDLKLEN